MFGCLVFGKLKATERRLEYEVKDVRNVASMSNTIELPEAKRQTYKHLMSGGDEEEEA